MAGINDLIAQLTQQPAEQSNGHLDPKLIPPGSGLEVIADRIRIPDQFKGKVITYERPIGDNLFEIRASEIRRERTGIHAKIETRASNIPLRWSNMNVEKDEDRTRLANSTHKMLSETFKQLYDNALLKYDLDIFCLHLWDIYVGSLMAEDLEGDPMIPMEFLLKPYIIAGAGTIMFAPPGRGKSYTGMIMGICIDAGVDTFWPVIQCPVLLVNLERSGESIQRRIGFVNSALGLEPQRKLATINARGRSLPDVHEAIVRSVERRGIRLIIVDSLSRSGPSSMNDDGYMNKVMDMLNQIGTAWLALGHTSRADESHVFGSVMSDAAADVMVRLMTEEDEPNNKMGVGLKITKANDIAKPPMEMLCYEFDDWGLQNIRRARRGEFVNIEGDKFQNPDLVISEYLKTYGKATATEVAEETGLERSTVSRYLSTSEKYVKVGKQGKNVFYGLGL